MKKGLLSKFLVAPVDREVDNIDEYLKMVEAGKFHNQVCYGIAEEKRGFLMVDPKEQPGALYVGGMGSGKSIALRFSIITRVITNSEHDFYILVDPLKGMTDYACLFGLQENVVTALNNPAKLVPVIEMVHEECMARKDEFSRLKAPSIYEYESKMRKQDPNYKMARIFIVVEEFHAVPNSEYIKFSYKSDTPGTAAYKLKELMRIGRSYGISMMAASQRATPDDFPSTLKPGITMLQAFRVNNPGDATGMNLPNAADIRMEQRGRCVYEGGQMQYPYVNDETAEVLLKKYYKPLKAKMLKYTVDDYHQALAGEGNEGMVRIKPYKEILANISQFNPLDVYTRFLETFNFKVEKQTNTALSVQLIAERDNIRYAVLAFAGRGGQSDKMMESFRHGAELLGCKGAILMTNEGNFGSIESKLKGFSDKILADGEDLQRMAEILDNRRRLEEEGNFDTLYEKLVFTKKVEVLESKSQEDESDEEEEDEDEAAVSFASLREKLRSGE